VEGGKSSRLEREPALLALRECRSAVAEVSSDPRTIHSFLRFDRQIFEGEHSVKLDKSIHFPQDSWKSMPHEQIRLACGRFRQGDGWGSLKMDFHRDADSLMRGR
jgi:hypothetical protein